MAGATWQAVGSMLSLTSFVHRAELAEIIARWMVNQPRAGDVQKLKGIVNFNTYSARIWVDRITRDLLRTLHEAVPTATAVRTKGEVKDFSVAHLPYTNARIEELCGHYRRFPEDFYRETPIDGSYYTVNGGAGPQIVAFSRIKRFRRIAEKGSRRIVDFMLQRIRINAERLADERAHSLGIARTQLISSPQEMEEEFRHAERRVIKSIKQGTIRAELPNFDIPDVVGIKLIVEDERYNDLVEAIGRQSDTRIVEVERHTGFYNAVNIHLEYTLPMDLLAAHPPSDRYLDVLVARGFAREDVPRLYAQFLAQCEPKVRVEIIVSTFQEYLESEIGRCMHEDRILSQRAHPEYRGHLATNVRYLMNYILTMCRSPRMEDIEDIPIKLWVKYMPDTVSYLVRALYLPEGHYFDAVPTVVAAADNGVR
ncbi:MAG: hypothetical protein AAB426_04875 [Myxococcota bacterium]